jgi:sec-independent protein translocase protein TatB
MFDLSFAELALIVIVAVIFIGPKDLPVVLRAVSKALKSIRGFGRELHKAFDDLSKESGVADIEREVRMLQGDDGKLYESYDMPQLRRQDRDESQ